MKEIVLRLPRCIIVLTTGELLALLQLNPIIWERALRRGKSLKRCAAVERREREVAKQL